MADRENKLKKQKEIDDERLIAKQKRDEDRKKMKEEILNKKKEMMKNNKGSEIKVEFIGVPAFMDPTTKD